MSASSPLSVLDPANHALQTLLRDSRLWRGNGQAPLRAEPTGHAQIDAILPGGGWPLAALSEIVYPAPGVGELTLAMPVLARLSQARRRIALVRPPLLPYAPALRRQGLVLERSVVVETGDDGDALWATEELLRAQAGVVLLWHDRIDTTAQRRLQLAAENGNALVLVYRRQAAEAGRRAGDEASVAALRLRIARVDGQPQVEVLKCRGARPQQRCSLQ